MNKTTQKQAIQWFAERFCHSEYSRDFVLQTHGIKEKTADKRARWQEYTRRNPRYQINFEPEGSGLLVTGVNRESAWANGLIGIDKQGKFHFTTRPVKTLFDDEWMGAAQ